MDTTFATLACYLLALSFPLAQAQKGKSTVTPTITTPDLNLTHTTAKVTPTNSTVHVTVISNSTENTTPLASTTQDNETFTKATAAITKSTSQLHTSQSTTIMTPLTWYISDDHNTWHSHSNIYCTDDASNADHSNISTPKPTTANSSHTVNTTSDSMDRTTQGLGLNFSEENMTIIFSVVLGVFAVALVVLMFHKCKQKIQYLHQPLNNTDDTDVFVADADTLVISGGLYDGHPIYDNVPTVTEDQSQFRLEFLH